MTKPFQAAVGTGIGLPGTKGRYGRGSTLQQPGGQQTQETTGDKTAGTNQHDVSEPSKQAS